MVIISIESIKQPWHGRDYLGIDARQPTEEFMKRPTSVTVFGILNIVFAVLGVIGIFASIAMLKFVGKSQANNPVVKALHDNVVYAAWFKIMIPLGLIASMVLLAAGIGLAMNGVFLLLPLLNQSSHGSTVEAAGQIGAAIGATIGSVFSLVYPILLLIFMTRPKVIAGFQPPAFQPA
jgi:hypothetical protein